MIETIGFILTGLGLTASIIYYANILNNANKTRELQLKSQQQAEETRQTQLFMNIYQTVTQDEFRSAYRLVMLSEWDSLQDFLEDYDWYNKEKEYSEIMKAVDYVTSYYEGVGVLVKEGLLDIHKVAIFFGALTRTSWEKFMPFV